MRRGGRWRSRSPEYDGRKMLKGIHDSQRWLWKWRVNSVHWIYWLWTPQMNDWSHRHTQHTLANGLSESIRNNNMHSIHHSPFDKIKPKVETGSRTHSKRATDNGIDITEPSPVSRQFFPFFFSFLFFISKFNLYNLFLVYYVRASSVFCLFFFVLQMNRIAKSFRCVRVTEWTGGEIVEYSHTNVSVERIRRQYRHGSKRQMEMNWNKAKANPIICQLLLSHCVS